MTRKRLYRIFLAILIMGIFFARTTAVSLAINPDGTSNETGNDDKPRGPANPDGDDSDPAPSNTPDPDDGDDTVPEGYDPEPSGTPDPNDYWDTVPEGADSTPSGTPSQAPTQAAQQVQPATSNETQSYDNSSSSDDSTYTAPADTTATEAPTEAPMLIATKAPEATKKAEPTAVPTYDSSKPVVAQPKMVIEKVKNEGLTNAVTQIWSDMSDKEKTVVEVGGGLIGADVIYNSVVKRIIKSSKLKKGKKLGKKGVKAGKKFEKPDFDSDPKKILTCLRASKSTEELQEMLKEKKFVSEKFANFNSLDELPELLENEKCDAVIIDIDSTKEYEEFKTFLDTMKKADDDRAFALIVDDSISPEIAESLKSLKKEKGISGFVKSSASKEVKLINLVLPLYKPKFDGENALEVVGGIADALGIPYVSNIIDVSLSGKEIVETVKEGNMNISDKATVIGELASILGFDQVEEVTKLVTNVNSVKNLAQTATSLGSKSAAADAPAPDDTVNS